MRGAVGQDGGRRRIGLRDLDTGNQQQAELCRDWLRNFVGSIAVDADIGGIRMVFGVVRQGDHIEPVTPGLAHLHGRPDATIREHGVQVEVAFQGLVRRHIGYWQRIPRLVLRDRHLHQRGTQDDHRR
jgi:hypothetical protein